MCAVTRTWLCLPLFLEWGRDAPSGRGLENKELLAALAKMHEVRTPRSWKMSWGCFWKSCWWIKLQLTSSVIICVCEPHLMKLKHSRPSITQNNTSGSIRIQTVRARLGTCKCERAHTHIRPNTSQTHTHTYLAYWLSSLLAIFSTSYMGRLKGYSLQSVPTKPLPSIYRLMRLSQGYFFPSSLLCLAAASELHTDHSEIFTSH